MRVVLDSNVYVSALLIGRNCEEILAMGRAGAIEILVSEEILSEVELVMGRKFRWREPDLKRLGEEIRSIGTMVEGDLDDIDIPADPDDAKVLACAVTGRADVIVTGDKKHLLPLGRYRGIPIVSPADFLEHFG